MGIDAKISNKNNRHVPDLLGQARTSMYMGVKSFYRHWSRFTLDVGPRLRHRYILHARRVELKKKLKKKKLSMSMTVLGVAVYAPQ